MTRGLDAIIPRQTLYAEAVASWSALGGPLERLEAGARLGPVGLFGFGELDRMGPRAGAGARITW